MTLDAGKQNILFVTLVFWLNYSSKADVTNLGGSLQLQLKSKTTKILLIKFVNTVVMRANKRFPLNEDMVNSAAERKTKLQSFLVATIEYFSREFNWFIITKTFMNIPQDLGSLVSLDEGLVS